MPETRHGHVKWENGQPIKYALGRVADRFKPDRDVLGDFDESRWPYDQNGQQTDPWVPTAMFIMTTRGGETVFTFSTHSFWGRQAAYRLIQNYAAEARQHLGCFPVISLGTTTHPSKKYGDVDGPTLEIVGWQEKPQQTPALTSLPEELDDKMKPTKSKSRGFIDNSDMDDDIPF